MMSLNSRSGTLEQVKEREFARVPRAQPCRNTEETQSKDRFMFSRLQQSMFQVPVRLLPL